MDIERDLSPPANDKIVPDVYNILDANLAKKISPFNNKLNYMLCTQEKVISKHRRDAERYLILEKARALDSLQKIHTTINSVTRTRDFDLKFFNRASLHTDPSVKKRKTYEKNDDAICQRCYIHHLPLKKKYYRKGEEDDFHNYSRKNFLQAKAADAFTKNRNHNHNLAENGHAAISTQSQHPEDATHLHEYIKWPHRDLDPPDDNQSETADVVPPLHPRLRRLSSTSLSSGSDVRPMGVFGWWMPTPQNQQFLWKDKSGREVDLNKGSTPRLATNEEWKDVVKSVCSSLHSRADTKR